MVIRSALLLAVLLAPPTARAQSESPSARSRSPGELPGPLDVREAVREGVEAYADGEYEFALARLRAAESATGFALLSPPERVLLHKYVGYCEIAFAKKEEAKAAFKLALAIDPELELDPDKVSPKILEVFREAKGESSAALAANGGVEPVATPAPTPVSQPHHPRFRPEPAMLVPGLPQLKRGETGKGLTLFTAGAASLGALAYLQWQSLVAESYIDRAGPDERADMKKQANDIHTLRSISVAPVLLVWGISAWDGRRREPAVVLQASPEGAAVTVAWSF